MTNAEKFEEVFGIKIDENFPSDPCDIFAHDICIEHRCNTRCSAYNFWDKKFKKASGKKEEN